MELKWNQPKDQSFEAGLDRGVIYLNSGEAVPWNGLSSVDDEGESSTNDLYLDGIKYLSFITPRDWSGSLEAYTYPDAFAELIGIAELGDGLYVDSQAPDSFGLSYRTMVGTQIDNVQHYKIHLIYNVMASLNGFTNETLSGSATDPTSFKFDLTAVPVQIPGARPSAHIILDTRTLDPIVKTNLETLLYGSESTSPAMPTVTELVDFTNFTGDVVVVYNGDGTWTATGSNQNVFMTDAVHFQIHNVAAEYLTTDIYRFLGLAYDAAFVISVDTDDSLYYRLFEGASNVAFDTDDVPYYLVGAVNAAIREDTDGVPYLDY